MHVLVLLTLGHQYVYVITTLKKHPKCSPSYTIFTKYLGNPPNTFLTEHLLLSAFGLLESSELVNH